MKHNRLASISLTFIIVLAVAYYGEMWYRRFNGNGGSGNKYYHFNSVSNNVLVDIINFKRVHKELWTPEDTTLFLEQKRGFMKDIYIKFYDNGKYYHTWLVQRTDTFIEKETTFVFGGTSTTPNWSDAEKVNHMPYFTKQKTLRKFQDLILNNLTIMPKDY